MASAPLRGLLRRNWPRDERPAPESLGSEPSWVGIVQAAGLALALALAFLMGLVPKRDYPYPLHVDEWIHYELAQALLHPGEMGSVSVEVGFHALLAQLHLVTGLDWFALFRWLPPVFFAATTLLTYVVGRRFGCGLEAAFLATLVPTTVRFLGPAFLVPVSVGILALPLLLFLLHSTEFRIREATLCSLTLLFVGAAHPTSALILGTVALIHGLFLMAFGSEVSLRGRLLKGSLVLLAVAGPTALFAAFRPGQVLSVLRTLVQLGGPTFLPPVRDAISKFGGIPAGLSVVGTFALTLRGGWRGYALVTSALALLAMISLYKWRYWGYLSLADRSWLHLLLLMALLAGYGVSQLGSLVRRVLTPLHPWLAGALVLALIALSLNAGVRARLHERYYQLVDEVTLADFLWIKEYLGPTQRVAVLRTDLARAYAPLTDGGKPYGVESWPFLEPAGREAMAFLYGGPPDERWWRDRRIGIVYAPHWKDSSPAYLDQPRPNVFVPSQLPPP